LDFIVIIKFGVGLALLLAGAELLVRNSAKIALILGLSPLVIGLTVVAFGTSSPEIAIGIFSAAGHQPEAGFGNVIGSNVFNLLFILGLASMLKPLKINTQVVRYDAPFFVLISIIVLAISSNEILGFVEGVAMLVLLAGYTAWAVVLSRRESKISPIRNKTDTGPEQRNAKKILMLSVLVAVGLGMLAFGSQWVVASAASMARDLGIDKFVIGLTVVAVGTSLPEVATSLVAFSRGEQDMAVGNVLGSSVFNLLGVLGIMSVLTGGLVVPEGALYFDLPVMTACAIAALPLLFTGHRLARWEGAVLFGYYLFYIGFVVADAAGHSHITEYNWVVIGITVPLTVLTAGIIIKRVLAIRKRRAGR